METITDKFTITKKDDYILGVHKSDSGYSFAIVSKEKNITLVIFDSDRNKPEYVINVDETYKTGDVFSFNLNGVNLEGFSYYYLENEKVLVDPYATLLSGVSDFDEKLNSKIDTTLCAKICNSGYDWKDDVRPRIPKEDVILYKLHPRGFTKSNTSKVKNPGTFKGITEKINHIKKLGVNAVELMPSYEFAGFDFGINYWGYSEGFYFSPKAAYTSVYGVKDDYTAEFKDMVRIFHKNNIEVYMEFYFPKDTYSGMIVDCVRFWKKEFHIDGAHLLCDSRVSRLLADDPYLADIKLIYGSWDEEGRNANLFDYNENYEMIVRRFLKGDENMLRDFSEAFRKKPRFSTNINFVADNNGFTLMDVYSYDRKHNEDNNENNKDGKDYNNSWNCGEEGNSRNRRVIQLRTRNRKNAMAILLTSQGIPLIYAGDEFGNSQNGNNNAYNQDNEVGWVDWSAFAKNRKFFTFVCEMIDFRKKHKILHTAGELMQCDYKYYGLPDISYHADKAWYPEMEHYNRHLGIMLCGKYAGDADDIYIGANMHWEEHELGLPKIPDKKWKKVIDTGENDISDTDNNKTVTVEPRSVVIFVSEKNS